MFFGEDKCMGVERFAQCQVRHHDRVEWFVGLFVGDVNVSLGTACVQATIGKMYNDLRPLKPDYQVRTLKSNRSFVRSLCVCFVD
jgi:hypothetical protein